MSVHEYLAARFRIGTSPLAREGVDGMDQVALVAGHQLQSDENDDVNRLNLGSRASRLLSSH